HRPQRRSHAGDRARATGLRLHRRGSGLSQRMTALTARIAEDFASSTASEPAAAGPAAADPGAAGPAARQRAAALKALETAGLPSSRDENWKYANLRTLERVRFLPAPAVPALPSAAELPAPLPGIARFVFIDGRFAPAHSAALAAGAGAVTLLSQAADGLQGEADGPGGAGAAGGGLALRHRGMS